MAKEKICIDNYITRIGSSCRLSSLTNCLYNFGIDIDESIIFFLYDGFKISYELNETEAIQMFFKKNNIIENIVADNDINLLLKYLDENIKKNLAIRCKVSTDGLEYSNIFKINKTNVHYIELIGYDFENKSFLISDGFVPEYPLRKFQGWINVKNFNHIKNCFYLFDYASLDNYRNGYDPNRYIDLLKGKIIQSLKNYFNTSQGQAALIKFSNDIVLYKPLWEDKFSIYLYELINQIKTHGIANRVLIMKKALLIIGNYDNEIIDELENLYKAWYGFSLMLFKFSITDGKNPEMVKNKLDRIIEKETTLFEKVLLYI